jgi:hypothetical protein
MSRMRHPLRQSSATCAREYELALASPVRRIDLARRVVQVVAITAVMTNS